MSSTKPKGLTNMIKLQNGVEMPQVGLGTWKAEPGLVGQAVKKALQCGYRHIDCASVYGNQKEIGQAIKEAMQEYGIKREELHVTSKLWITEFEPQYVRPAYERTCKELQLEYLDLFLLHWPLSLKYVPYEQDSGACPKDAKGMIEPSFTPIIATWREMERLYNDKRVRAIGISNFSLPQIIDLMAQAQVKPMVNQIEIHPMYVKEDLVRMCLQKLHVHITAYSPFGSGTREILENETLHRIGQKHGKNPGQVIVRWCIQRGVSVIPKSTTEKRIESNLDVFDFELSSEEMKEISKLDKRLLTCNTRDFWGFSIQEQ